jgi:hypothetical protein
MSQTTMHNRVHKIPGTQRQSVTAADGTAMQRMYVYLPSHVWHLLQEAARVSGTSVSQTIQAFATSGTANSKEIHVSTSTRIN